MSEYVFYYFIAGLIIAMFMIGIGTVEHKGKDDYDPSDTMDANSDRWMESMGRKAWGITVVLFLITITWPLIPLAFLFRREMRVSDTNGRMSINFRRKKS